MENRQSAEELESDLASHGPGLEALQAEMAFSPNLTPAINKVKPAVNLLPNPPQPTARSLTRPVARLQCRLTV